MLEALGPVEGHWDIGVQCILGALGAVKTLEALEEHWGYWEHWDGMWYRGTASTGDTGAVLG